MTDTNNTTAFRDPTKKSLSVLEVVNKLNTSLTQARAIATTVSFNEDIDDDYGKVFWAVSDLISEAEMMSEQLWDKYKQVLNEKDTINHRGFN